MHGLFVDIGHPYALSMLLKYRRCVSCAKGIDRRLDFDFLVAIEVLDFFNYLKPIFYRHLEVRNNEVDGLVDTLCMRGKALVEKLSHQVYSLLPVTCECDLVRDVDLLKVGV